MQGILPFLDNCVRDVFATMVGLQAVPVGGDGAAVRPTQHSGMTGSICLTGKFNGVVYASFSDAFARLVAGRILGANLSDGEVCDVVGEITNMISGNLKSQMCDRGFNCALSIPTVMRGDDITIDVKDAPSLTANRYNFDEVNEHLTVHVFSRPLA